MLKMKTIAAPAAMPGRLRGRVTFLNRWKPLLPRFSACSSRLGSICTMLENMFRNAIGQNIMVWASITPAMPETSSLKSNPMTSYMR